MLCVRRLTIIVTLTLMLCGCGGRRVRPDVRTDGSSTMTSVVGERFLVSATRFAEQRAVDTLDMGRMADGEVVSRMVALRNDGDVPLLFVRTSTSCGCVSVELPEEPLAAGDEVVVPFRFDSAGYGGIHVARPIYIYTSISDEPLMVVVIAEVR